MFADDNLSLFASIAGCATLVLGFGLVTIMNKNKNGKTSANSVEVEVVEEVVELDKSKFPGGYLTVYYGSQTGTAECFAQDIERDGEENGFKVNVVDLEEIVDDTCNELLKDQMKDDNGKSRAIFLMATYGEGEPTDNAAGFSTFLKDNTGVKLIGEAGSSADVCEEEKKGEDDIPVDAALFAGLDFAVFGLGNRQYEHFNAMGKLVDEGLEKGGANRLLKLGLGDDDNDLEGDFETWKDSKLWPALKKQYISSEDMKSSKSNTEKMPECPYTLEYLDGPANIDDIPINDVHLSSKHYFTAVDCPVTLKRELRNETDEGSTLHVEIDISNAGEGLKYQTADNLGILPINNDKVVEKIAQALNYDLSAYFRLHPAKGHESKYAALFPNPCTVKDCLSRYCDLTGPPRRSELKLFAAYAKDPTSKKALLRMASKEGKVEYKEKILEAKIGIVDIISKLCPSIEIPLEHFLSICPRLQPRYYTISSSSTVHPTTIHLTVSVLKKKRRDGSSFEGVCSNYLSVITDTAPIRVFTRDSTFRLPADTTKPIVMIGPGTGIAPMRALLQERAHQKNVLNLPVGENVLYFGCKNRDQDFIYSDELDASQKEGTLTKMHLAFSREQDKKVYVQQLLAKNSKETWDLVNDQGAYIYVCGGVKMGQDVSETLRKIIGEHGNRSTTDAKKYLEQMASAGRFVQELWA